MAERVRLAIVGGGPAGLSAALEARRMGIAPLVVLERETEAGGAARHCGHLGFGMLDLRRMLTGPRYAAALRGLARPLDLRLNHAVTAIEPGGVVRVSTPDGPTAIEAERVLIATGIREMTRAERLTGGNRPFGVMTTGALQRFVYLNGVLPCRRPLIVGTEYVSLSTLLTLRHGGVKPVAFVAEESPTPAPRALVALAGWTFGVPVLHGTVETVAGLKQVEGVVLSHGGVRQEIACDAVIFTGRWIPENTLVRRLALGMDVASGPDVDATLRTRWPAIYAAGNVRYAVRSSGRCALEGRRAARAIAADLTGGAVQP